MLRMISWLTDVLADPLDGHQLTFSDDGTSLRSATGRTFAIVPPGYAMLTGEGISRQQGDSAPMVTARETFLSRGHFAPVVEAVTRLAVDSLDERDLPEDIPVTVLDAGAGTGYYLAHTLDQVDQARGIGLDVSTDAACLLTDVHPRAAAVVSDVDQRLPLRDASIDILTSVFSPGNLDEFERVLVPGGRVIFVCSQEGHLAELSELMGVNVDDSGAGRALCEEARKRYGDQLHAEELEFTMRLDRDSIINQLTMSPAACTFSADDVAERLDALADTTLVTVKVVVGCIDSPGQA